MSFQRYLTNSDAYMRLQGSIVTLDGYPFIVNSTENKNAYGVIYKGKGKFESTNIECESPLLDVSSPKLGFVRFQQSDIHYLMRFPARKQKAGIVYYNTIGYSPKDETTKTLDFNFKSLAPYLYEEYDNFLDIGKKEGSLILNRDLALLKKDNGYVIVWKYYRIGYINDSKSIYWTYNKSIKGLGEVRKQFEGLGYAHIEM